MSSITNFEIQGRRALKVIVFVDGEPWVTLDAETVVRLNLRRGEALTPARRERILLTDETVRARKAAARHAATQPKTRRELERCLISRGFSEAARTAALAELESSGTIDDPSVAGRIVRSRRRKKNIGPLRLKAELSQRGVDPQELRRQVDAAFEGVDLLSECLELIDKIRAKFEPLSDPKQKARLVGNLMRRGYDGEVVREAIERKSE
ncbi:MAG: regulatory protein RecX [Candidatus Sumerlaeia bacterium]